MAEPVDHPAVPRAPSRTSIDVGSGCTLVVEHFLPIMDFGVVEEVARTLIDVLQVSRVRGLKIGIQEYVDDGHAVRRLRLEAGDALVVRLDGLVDARRSDGIRRDFEEMFPGHRVIVLTGSASLDVVGEAAADALAGEGS